MIGLIVICMACSDSPTKEEDWEQNVEQPDLTNMVLIPAGEFLMGSPDDEGAFDEHPQRKVYLDDFYIDKYEVTADWERRKQKALLLIPPYQER